MKNKKLAQKIEPNPSSSSALRYNHWMKFDQGNITEIVSTEKLFWKFPKIPHESIHGRVQFLQSYMW